MKKVAMIAVVLLLGITLLSAAGSWSSSEDSPLTEEPNSQTATMNVSLNLTAGGDNPETETVTIGFSSNAVTPGGDSPSDKSTAILTDNGNMQGALSEDEPRYIYWKIASPSKLKIWLDYPEKMTDGDTSPTNTLDWTITTTPQSGSDSGTAISTESTKDGTIGYLVLDRSNPKTFGTVGSQQLHITTESYSNAVIDTYTATLTLKVASV